jgi:hypothetical protein
MGSTSSKSSLSLSNMYIPNCPLISVKHNEQAEAVYNVTAFNELMSAEATKVRAMLKVSMVRLKNLPKFNHSKGGK